MDDIDKTIIRRIMDQGRITWSELGSILGLSAPAAAERVRKLEEKGIIKGYSAQVDPEAVGCGLTAFISLTLERPEHRSDFLKAVGEMSEVLECHHITGDEDYLLKIRCPGIKSLEYIVSRNLKGIAGVTKTRTTVVLSTVKETTAMPIP
ncbi:MAG: Lrp/AsnC family transcriptional regulator [Bacillota bacterium]